MTERQEQLAKLASLRGQRRDPEDYAFGPARLAGEEFDLTQEVARAKRDKDLDLLQNMLQRTDLSAAEKSKVRAALKEVEEDLSGSVKQAWYPGSGSFGQSGGSPKDPKNKAKIAEIKKVLDRAGLWKDIDWYFTKHSEFDSYQVGWAADEVGEEFVVVTIMWEWNERYYHAYIDPIQGSLQSIEDKDLSRVARWLKKNLQPYMKMSAVAFGPQRLRRAADGTVTHIRVTSEADHRTGKFDFDDYDTPDYKDELEYMDVGGTFALEEALRMAAESLDKEGVPVSKVRWSLQQHSPKIVIVGTHRDVSYAEKIEIELDPAGTIDRNELDQRTLKRLLR